MFSVIQVEGMLGLRKISWTFFNFTKMFHLLSSGFFRFWIRGEKLFKGNVEFMQEDLSHESGQRPLK